MIQQECKAAMDTNTAKPCKQSRQASQQGFPPRGSRCLESQDESRRLRRATLCPAELQRNPAQMAAEVSGFEEEKMLFEENFCLPMAGRVSMSGKPRGPYRRLARGRMHRFVSKVSDDLRFRDVLWRSAVFSVYTADERRRLVEERNFAENRDRLGWLSLDGRLMNAEPATSVQRIGGDLGYEEAVTWRGFSPLQRVLIVAVAATAAASSKKNEQIKRLERSVDNRDQALVVMRRKLNDLWERIFSLQDQSGNAGKNSSGGKILDHEDDSNAGVTNTGNCKLWEQEDEDGLRNLKGPTGSAETIPLDSTHAPCAAAILELKRRTEHMIEKEASDVMAAFASVLEKVEVLEGYRSSPTDEGGQNNAQGVALGGLKASVEQASAQITSLQMSLFDIWHALLPEALCSINISPSELDHYLDKAKKESSLLFPSKQFSTQAWKQWLNMQEHASEANFMPILQDEPEEDGLYNTPLTATEQEERRLSDMSDWSSTVTSFSDHNIWHSVEADVASAIGAAVRRTVDKIIAPIDAQISKSSPHEMVVEKLLSELETAAGKVVDMESQLGSLKEYLKISEMRRKEAEKKLANTVKQRIQNQAEANMEIVELVEQLQLEDQSYLDLIQSHKLNFAAKEEEIARLRKECKKKDATIREITSVAQASKDASDKKVAILEDILKKKNTTIMRLKEEMVVLEEKVLQLMRSEIPSSSNRNYTSLLPPIMSTNILFDMEDIPSSPDSDRLHDIHAPSLIRSEDQDLAADEYASSSSQGINDREERSSAKSSASSPIPGRYRRESTGSNASKHHSSLGSSGQSTLIKDRLWNGSADTKFMNENTKSGSLSPHKIKTSRSSSVLAGVDINATLKSRRAASDSEGGQRSTRSNKSNKSKDITSRKRWV